MTARTWLLAATAATALHLLAVTALHESMGRNSVDVELLKAEVVRLHDEAALAAMREADLEARVESLEGVQRREVVLLARIDELEAELASARVSLDELTKKAVVPLGTAIGMAKLVSSYHQSGASSKGRRKAKGKVKRKQPPTPVASPARPSTAGTVSPSPWEQAADEGPGEQEDDAPFGSVQREESFVAPLDSVPTVAAARAAQAAYKSTQRVQTAGSGSHTPRRSSFRRHVLVHIRIPAVNSSSISCC